MSFFCSPPRWRFLQTPPNDFSLHKIVINFHLFRIIHRWNKKNHNFPLSSLNYFHLHTLPKLILFSLNIMQITNHTKSTLWKVSIQSSNRRTGNRIKLPCIAFTSLFYFFDQFYSFFKHPIMKTSNKKILNMGVGSFVHNVCLCGVKYAGEVFFVEIISLVTNKRCKIDKLLSKRVFLSASSSFYCLSKVRKSLALILILFLFSISILVTSERRDNFPATCA